jgi:hypothetical protein
VERVDDIVQGNVLELSPLNSVTDKFTHHEPVNREKCVTFFDIGVVDQLKVIVIAK